MGALEEAFGGYTRLELPLVIGIDSVEFGTVFPPCTCLPIGVFHSVTQERGVRLPSGFPSSGRGFRVNISLCCLCV